MRNQIWRATFLIVVILPAFAYADPHFHRDKVRQFEITIPADWKITDYADSSPFLRCFGVSPNDELSIEVYAAKVDEGRVDLDKLVDSAHRVFKNLGPEMDRRQSNGRYEITFGRNSQGLYSKGIFAVKEEYYYVILASSKVNDYTGAAAILDSFKINAGYKFLTLVFFLGSLSLVFHLLLLHKAFFAEPCGTLLKSILRWKIWNAEFAVAMGFALLIAAIDYFVIRKLIGAFAADGSAGLAKELFNIGPELFEFAGELLSEGMAELIGFGFWPGGSTGVVLTTVVSLAVNVFEVRYLATEYAAKIRTYREATD